MTNINLGGNKYVLVPEQTYQRIQDIMRTLTDINWKDLDKELDKDIELNQNDLEKPKGLLKPFSPERNKLKDLSLEQVNEKESEDLELTKGVGEFEKNRILEITGGKNIVAQEEVEEKKDEVVEDKAIALDETKDFEEDNVLDFEDDLEDEEELERD